MTARQRMRELSVALSSVGLDPRDAAPPGRPGGDRSLWQGTTVDVEEFLAAGRRISTFRTSWRALARSAARLGELWDMWGRLRPLLLTPA